MSIPTPPGPFGMPLPAPTLAERPEGNNRASILPLVIASVLLVASIAIQLLIGILGNSLWYYVGYVLTPLLVTMCLGWDLLAQRTGRKNPWYEAKPNYTKLLRYVAIAGFVVAAFHIVQIGILIGEQVVQAGVSI